MEVDSKKLQQLYIAYFGRPADPSGLKYWLSKAKSGLNIREIANYLSIQNEYKNSIMNGKDLDFQINKLYLNLYSRKADFAGLNYWLGAIKSGTHNISDIACDLIWASLNLNQSHSEQALKDKKTLENKVQSA